MPNPKLDAAIKNCRNFRSYVKKNNAAKELSTKGFLLTREMIDNIMKQSGDIAGIRIYVGLDETGAVKPCAVGCVKNGEKYNDYKIKRSGVGIPSGAPQAAITSMGDGTNTTLTGSSTGMEDDGPVVEEPRPCPSECSDDNDLNTGE
jgi:hypothetical protein